MAKLEWLESFEVGVPEIDNDHKEMLSIMQRIEAAADSENYDLCTVLLDELIAHSRAHFAREEKYLDRIDYPQVDIHRDYHAKLIVKADAVKEVCQGIRSHRNLKDCCDEMFKFLIDDVVSGDMRIKSYLDEKGLTKRP